MSKKALEILKRKMTLEERKLFVENCVKCNGEDWWKKLDGMTIEDMMVLTRLSFIWKATDQSRGYWQEIYDRFTTDEILAKIQL